MRLFSRDPAIWLVLTDGSMQMLTDSTTAGQVLKEYPGHRVWSLSSQMTPLSPSKSLSFGHTYQLLPMESSRSIVDSTSPGAKDQSSRAATLPAPEARLRRRPRSLTRRNSMTAFRRPRTPPSPEFTFDVSAWDVQPLQVSLIDPIEGCVEDKLTSAPNPRQPKIRQRRQSICHVESAEAPLMRSSTAVRENVSSWATREMQNQCHRGHEHLDCTPSSSSPPPPSHHHHQLNQHQALQQQQHHNQYQQQQLSSLLQRRRQQQQQHFLGQGVDGLLGINLHTSTSNQDTNDTRWSTLMPWRHPQATPASPSAGREHPHLPLSSSGHTPWKSPVSSPPPATQHIAVVSTRSLPPLSPTHLLHSRSFRSNVSSGTLQAAGMPRECRRGSPPSAALVPMMRPSASSPCLCTEEEAEVTRRVMAQAPTPSFPAMCEGSRGLRSTRGIRSFAEREVYPVLSGVPY